MKVLGWAILIAVAVLVAIVTTFVAQRLNLLQARVDQGIGSSTKVEQFVPETVY